MRVYFFWKIKLYKEAQIVYYQTFFGKDLRKVKVNGLGR